jgi:hypothetical protein
MLNVFPVTPVFHVITPKHPLGVNIVELPAQKLVFPEIVGALGIAFSVTDWVCETVLVHPFSVQVAL